MITITDNARTHLVELLQMNNEKSVLLSVNSKGCGGNSYQMHFFSPEAGDEIVPLDEEHVIAIDQRSVMWLIGVKIDFVETDLGSEFVFENPIEAGRCGCGQSFTTKPCS